MDKGGGGVAVCVEGLAKQAKLAMPIYSATSKISELWPLQKNYMTDSMTVGVFAIKAT